MIETVWGEFAAPGAVIVTRPLTEMLLTVTVCRCPLSSEPLGGDILYPCCVAVALQVMTPSPSLVIVNWTLDPRHTKLLNDAGATDNPGWPGAGVTVAVAVAPGVTVPDGGVPEPGVPAGGDPVGDVGRPTCAFFVEVACDAESVAVGCEPPPTAGNSGRWTLPPVALLNSTSEPPTSNSARPISASSVGSFREMRRGGVICVRVSVYPCSGSVGNADRLTSSER